MNFELFISRRIISGDKSNFSRPIIRISIISITLGLAVMIISLAITTGFKKAISDKVIAFGSHIQITNYDLNRSFEAIPISMDQPFYPSLSDMDGVKHIQVFGTKSGLIKTNDQIQGIVMKGVWKDYDWDIFKDKIVEGSVLEIDSAQRTNDILISKMLADKLNFKLGDEVRAYFINPDEVSPRGRKFVIRGIYETGLEEFDDIFIIGDIRHIQRLNKWDDDMVSGFDVYVDNFKDLDKIYEQVYDEVGYKLDATSIKELYPQIFDWLNLQDMNVIIILILMIAVAVINMISTLLILILEKTNMIGILKALGARNLSIRKVFVYNATFIIGRGLLWGNLFGLAIIILQQQFHFLKLDQESYYVPYVPVTLDWLSVLAINAGTVVVCVVFMIVPSYVITKVNPVKAIRWE
nr:ABC transporter permease [Bacteroidota bacterium]